MEKQFSYTRHERLKSRKLIEQIFSDGKSFSDFPLKVYYRFAELPSSIHLQAGVSVGTRNFKKAVDRNRIKRLLREAYRLSKPSLLKNLAATNKQLILFFIYTGKELPAYEQVLAKMEKLLLRFPPLLQAENLKS